MDKRLGPTFHRTFSLIRPGLSHALRIAAQNAACTKELLRTGSPLGPEQINAMMRYAYGTRLLDADNRITSLGKTIHNSDPTFDNQQTLWILHYNLSSPQSLAPAFWGHIITKIFRPESEVTTNSINRTIADFYANVPDTKCNERSSSDCATALLGTYSDDRSMAALGLLTQLAPGEYMVNEPTFPRTATFAYLLALCWETHFPNTITAPLSAVSEGLCPLLLTGSGVLKQALDELQALGLVRVQQRTFPYQVETLWSSVPGLLQKVYE